ncbi:MAG: LysR family transcriptional regulator, partial [Pyramidobacter sp.]|nr:LysR family transcriptional regulator [Pyramidobacter sp.]
MRLEQFNLFLTVLNSGSFAAAGRLLHMSQPSITAALNSLEEEVGARLLERSPGQRRPVTATEAGVIF